ncbi:MAG: hypothetical protein COT36_04250 [Parcubacteria group bacterium CG08_land_8_20_14_0_20_38_56]|nr:MAG: hypothetical protein COT36_04250 [Parcubacteria group bacterium CG08_land_8_20_14_0_20_38_56]
MDVELEQLKKALFKGNLISPEKLELAEKKAKELGQKLEDVLVGEKAISEENLVKIKAETLKIPFVNLEKEIISPRILETIPESLARRYNVIAFKQIGNDLLVAMLNPGDLQTIKFIEKKTGLKVLPYFTTAQSIKNILKQYIKTLVAEFEELIKEAEEMSPILKDSSKNKNLKKIAVEIPVIRMVDILLKHAILESASDIHIEPMEKKVVIRYRIDGILYEVLFLPKQVHPGIIARIKVLANLKLDEHRLPQDGRFKIETEGYKISFRVSIMPVFYGEKVVMRLLPEAVKVSVLDELGLSGDALRKIQSNIKSSEGLILVTGPTGCGKTTTLYTILNILNSTRVNISTIEDPIEYCIPMINQTQVKPAIGLTFANGLRSLVRQDPDILMVGEIRDVETASLSINAALTGHLVLSTLHTNSAAGAFPRLIDMGAKGFLIVSTAKLIIAQRLVRRLCDSKKNHILKDSEIKSLNEEYNMDSILNMLKKKRIVGSKTNWKDIKFARPQSSKICPEGYKGRIGIFEVLEVSESIKELIIRGVPSDKIEEQAKKEGMTTMLEDGFIKAVQGITTIEEIFRVIRE